MKNIDNLTLVSAASLAYIGALVSVGPLIVALASDRGEKLLIIGAYGIPVALILATAFGVASLLRGVTGLRLFLAVAASVGTAFLILSAMRNA